MSIFGSMSGRSTNKFNKIITYLSQKLIDTETDNKQIFNSGEDNLPENIDTFDISQVRDLGIRSTLKTTGNIYRMVTGADSQNLRCWIKFSNAAQLYDYSRNGLTSYVYGLGQIPILNSKKVPQNVLGYEWESYFNGHDQYAYTDDHEKIRISDMFADGEVDHISFFDRFYPISLIHKIAAENSVLFAKIDDDQLKDGYAATMNKEGDLFFYIRRDFKQYSLFLKGVYADLVADELANGGNYLASNYSSSDYSTDETYSQNLLCSIITGDDHWFVFDKATNSMKYILNGIDLTPAPFTVAPVLDVPFQDGAYNTDGSDRTTIHDISGNDYHGTLSNPENGQWQTNNTFFNFGSNTAGNGGGCKTTFPTIAALDSANDFTISFMYKPDNIINTNSWFEYIIRKNWQTDGSFIMYRPPSSGNITAEYRDPTGIKRSVTASGAITTTDWHSIILKCERSQPMKIIIDGVTYTGSSALPATALTSTGVLEIGNVNVGLRGTICYFRVFDSALSTTDIDLLVAEGYHNPTFPKSEKPQPEPQETPPPVTNPFEVFYNLASQTIPFSPTATNTVWLNSVEGDSEFVQVYDVADGVDESFPEEAIYDVADGATGGSDDPFAEEYRFDNPSGNSSVQCNTSDNDAGGIEVQSGHALIGKKITRAIFYLKGESSPSGSVYCRIWDSNDNVVATLDYWNGSSLGTLNAANVNSSDWQAYEFRNTTYNWGSTSIQSGWVIGIEYHASSGGDTIHIRRDTTNPKSNVVQAARNYNSSSFSSNSSNDVAGILYSGGGTSASDPFMYIEYSQKIGGGDSNTYRYDRILEKFGSGDPTIGLIPTKVKVKLKRVGSPGGTLHCYLCSGHTGSVIEAEFGSSLTVNSISTTTTEYTFTLAENVESITANWNIMLFWEGGSNNGGKIGVMTNTGVSDPHPPSPASNTISYIQKYGYVPGFEGFANHLINYTSLDISGKIFQGGNEFDSTVSFTSSTTRHYIKGTSSTSSSVVGKKLTKAIVRARKVGTPTGLMTCNIRDNDGSNTVRFSLGTFDVSTLDDTNFEDVTFTNVFNTLSTEINDRICFEYLGADASNYVELKINKDVFEGLNTIGGSYSSPSNTDNAQIDLAGKLYTGGEPDVNSRIRVGQKIIVNDESVMDGNKLTKIGVWLVNPDAVLGNINCIVYRGSDDNPIVTIGDPIPASGIGNTYEYVEFENTLNGYVLNVNDVVAIVFNSGSPSQRLGVHVRQNTGYDGENSHVVRYNGQEYDDMEDYDLVATMWFGGDTYQPPPFAQPDPTPTNNKALLYCAGNNLLSGFARVAQREFAIYSEDTTEEEAMNKYENRYSKTERSPQEVLLAGLYRPF